MIAVDTNVVVRLITADDKDQLAAIEARLPQGFFVSHGVLMETEWVLRSIYRMDREDVGRALHGIVTMEEIRVPNPSFVLWALDRHGEGADFADMLHLVAARGVDAFLTFDRDLARSADGAPVEIELLG